MNKREGVYYRKDPTAILTAEALALNVSGTSEADRMLQLRTGAVGGVLLVTQLLGKDGAVQPPFITVLAAPSVATYSHGVADAGPIFADIWDDEALADFPATVDSSVANYPVLGAQTGFSRAEALPTKILSLLVDAQPILLPSGQQLGQSVLIEGVSHQRAFFLPEVCNLPLGLRWPTSIGFTDFALSISAAFGKPSAHFSSILTALQPSLATWFASIHRDPLPFVIHGCVFLGFYDSHFRCIPTGEYPTSLLDQQAFSPLADMLNGFLWRLWCDRILTTASPTDRKHLQAYLLAGAQAITASTYLGAQIPARFCPNFAYHFKVTNGWPTDAARAEDTQGFLHDFEHSPLISWQAMQHARLDVNLHDLIHPIVEPLQTREERSSAKHKTGTPRVSYPNPDVPVIPIIDIATKPPVTPQQAVPRQPPFKGLQPMSEIKRFVPSPQMTLSRPLTMSVAPPAARSLTSEFQRLAPDSLPVSSGRFDPISGTIYTHAGRADAHPLFLTCCQLIVHHATSIHLLDPTTKHPLSSDFNIFVREPCRLFRSEILKPLLAAPTGQFLSTFQSLIEAILRSVQVNVTSTFAPSFFTASFLHSLYSVDAWMVNTHIAPASVPPQSFHVYRLLTSLPSYSVSSMLLPANGLTILEAKHLGILTYYLFAMIDLPDTLQDVQFRKSALGSRLKAWSVLPDNPNVHTIWSQHPGQATYQWLQSLQHLLSLFQAWIKWLRYHPTHGFLETHDTKGSKHLLLDNQIPSSIPDRQDSLIQVLQQFDLSFQARWYQNTAYDAVWSSPIPQGHSLAGPSPVKHPPSSSIPDSGAPATKRRKPLSGLSPQSVPDFVNNTPLVEAVQPFTSHRPMAQQLLTRLARTPFPKFETSTGTLTLCFLSAFAPPHNSCVRGKCMDRKRQCRMHVDLSQEPWRSKPESFWSPLVQFLKDPLVAIHLRPSPSFRRVTPSVTWT
jgi:hypothetical protein